ncbi:MAG TPA: CAP domain-containing protein [Gemmataceae bacterium]|nr:CAP domain-containing protein [Gemmataceae bacterium]
MAHPVRTFSCAIIVAVCAVLVVPVDGQEKPAVKLSAEEQKVLELTNAARKEKKLPPLKLSAQLTEAARKHSMNMAKQRKLSRLQKVL